jgi:hypothetical protein
MIGGISHQELVAINSFERNQIVNGNWNEERIIMGSTQR